MRKGSNPAGLESLMITSETDFSKLPDVAWVQQGVSAMRRLMAGKLPHAHRVFVRSDGYLQVFADVPPQRQSPPLTK